VAVQVASLTKFAISFEEGGDVVHMASKKGKANGKSAKPQAPAKKVSKPKNGVQYSQSEFYDIVRESCGFESRRTAKEVYGAFSGMIQSALKKGYRVPLPGIGKIQVRHSKARMGRNPATGEQIQISARKRVRLTPSKALKEAVL
jgi:DNA-binding protein HU-beta